MSTISKNYWWSNGHCSLGQQRICPGFRLGGVKRVYTVKPDKYEEKLLELIADNSIGVLAIDSNDLKS